MSIIKNFLYLLTSNEQKRAGLLMFMILIMALLEMIGVASILPFMSVLTNPSIINKNIIQIRWCSAGLFRTHGYSS